MNEVQLNLSPDKQGRFYIEDGDEVIGEMVISIEDGVLTVYHTEVAPVAQGKGLARIMMDGMVAYARDKHLKVKALCPYVHAQFKRSPEAYADIIYRP
jgi:predicted GNAT family acetyltransferase